MPYRDLQETLMRQMERRRMELGLGVAKLCKIAGGMSTATWYNYAEVRTSPTLEACHKIAEALETSLDVGLAVYARQQLSNARIGEDMAIKTLEAREVAALVDTLPPEVRTYVRDMCYRVAANQSPTEPARDSATRRRK